ncbi:hypothetical protein PJ985_16580 [Streptomyces sp. ACA25]|uniref:hypothetical protein n=1 Tax=Streptomyces sp. ACA25 TaxID=3022596 RepID=UPI00230722B3|nr:hypothetical protein [Streptomyces sp. ACA25]MDB1089179.1 hypothetical protein [Streptomyces sp. ACA25]
MSDEPPEQRRGAWPPRGVALSLLISMGAWLLFGSPMGGSGPSEPLAESAAGWQLIPGSRSEIARCDFQGGWAALEYRRGQQTRVGEDLLVQQGDRWEFEDPWRASDILWVLGGEQTTRGPAPAELTELEVAEELQSAPSHWRFGSRTACVLNGDSTGAR